MNITPLPILSILIWFPIIGGSLLLFLNKEDTRYLRFFSILISSLTLFLSVFILMEFNFNLYKLQFVEIVPWIEDFKINYHLAIDGVSLLFILLTSVQEVPS